MCATPSVRAHLFDYGTPSVVTLGFSLALEADRPLMESQALRACSRPSRREDNMRLTRLAPLAGSLGSR